MSAAMPSASNHMTLRLVDICATCGRRWRCVRRRLVRRCHSCGGRAALRLAVSP